MSEFRENSLEKASRNLTSRVRINLRGKIGENWPKTPAVIYRIYHRPFLIDGKMRAFDKVRIKKD